ncbi:hypothetical protein [Bacillus sp. FJAT-47783]|uniref:hypothetical protein n=1 Tax=Bacillus sp. FJAT-47783 TaxID=2922712 RepID=UPI001FAC6B60|nr:hypothetical protein [Bacillus sp. FJAT-47783]
MEIQNVPQEKRNTFMINLKYYESQLNGFSSSLQKITEDFKEYEQFEHTLKQNFRKMRTKIHSLSHTPEIEQKQNHLHIEHHVNEHDSLKKILKQKNHAMKEFEKKEEIWRKTITLLNNTVNEVPFMESRKETIVKNHTMKETVHPQKRQSIQQQVKQLQKELELKNIVIERNDLFMSFLKRELFPFLFIKEETKNWLVEKEHSIQTISEHFSDVERTLSDIKKNSQIQLEEYNLCDKRKWMNMIWPGWNQEKAEEQRKKLIQLNDAVEKIQGDLLEYKKMLSEIENTFSNYQVQEITLKEKVEDLLQHFNELQSKKEQELYEKIEKLTRSLNEKEEQHQKKESEYQNKIEQINGELQQLQDREEQYKKVIQQLKNSLNEAYMKLTHSNREESPVNTPSHHNPYTSVINPFKYSRKK